MPYVYHLLFFLDPLFRISAKLRKKDKLRCGLFTSKYLRITDQMRSFIWNVTRSWSSIPTDADARQAIYALRRGSGISACWLLSLKIGCCKRWRRERTILTIAPHTLPSINRSLVCTAVSAGLWRHAISLVKALFRIALYDASEMSTVWPFSTISFRVD